MAQRRGCRLEAPCALSQQSPARTASRLCTRRLRPGRAASSTCPPPPTEKIYMQIYMHINMYIFIIISLYIRIHIHMHICIYTHPPCTYLIHKHIDTPTHPPTPPTHLAPSLVARRRPLGRSLHTILKTQIRSTITAHTTLQPGLSRTARTRQNLVRSLESG